MKIRDEDVISDEKHKCSPRITDMGRLKNFGIWLQMIKEAMKISMEN